MSRLISRTIFNEDQTYTSFCITEKCRYKAVPTVPCDPCAEAKFEDAPGMSWTLPYHLRLVTLGVASQNHAHISMGIQTMKSIANSDSASGFPEIYLTMSCRSLMRTRIFKDLVQVVLCRFRFPSSTAFNSSSNIPTSCSHLTSVCEQQFAAVSPFDFTTSVP